MNVSASADTGGGSIAAKNVTVIGFGRRLIANLVDAVFVFFFTFIVTFLIGFLALLFDIFKQDNSFPINQLTIVSGLLASIIYFVGFWVSSGQTMGKFITGIKVTKTDGAKLSFGAAIVRYIGYLISAVVLSIGFLWLAFDKQRQGWHDKMAGTLVVQADEDRLGSEGVTLEPSDPHRNWVWLVIWIVVALAFPSGLLGGLFILGPIVRRFMFNLLGVDG